MAHTVDTVTSADAPLVADILADAFHDYPVMRFVVGSVPETEYAKRLRVLVGFFVSARETRNETMLLLRDGGEPVAAAILTPPGEREASAELDRRREETWALLGADARARYEECGRVWTQFAIDEAHHHLNMIGVLRSHAGRGHSRPLLEAVHGMADEDPGSAGVSLTTEDHRNVSYYEYFGYRVVGRARVGEAFDTWGFFRPSG